MKLPSIQQVIQEAALTLRRFPLVLADAAVGTLVALILVENEGQTTSGILFKILFASLLGFPLLLASTLVAERRDWSRSTALGVQLMCVFLLVAYAFSLPSNVASEPLVHVIRLLMLGLALCLLAVTAPFATTSSSNGFWQYNKILVQRLILTGLFSATLFAGLAIAMASVDQLFGVDVPEQRYAELGLFVLGIFSTWFFLADVPKDMNGLELRTDYPKFLTVFGQYILSPMLIVYFVILSAYIAKIIIEWRWPKGLVSGVIFGFAAMGISAYLLLHPVREKTEFRWIKIAARWFWIVLIPMIVVLQLAIWRRVSEYGFTENRYFALGLGVWLAAMAVYFLASNAKSIKVLPASICVLALLTSFGPWGVFKVSERSQVARLEELLANNQLLIDGTAQKAQGKISPVDAAQISSIVHYLYDTHGYEEIQPWFGESLMRDSAGVGFVNLEPAIVVNSLGVEYTRSSMIDGSDHGELVADSKRAISIEGYDHLVVAEHLSSEKLEFSEPSTGATCRIDTSLDVLTLRLLEAGAVIDSAQIRLRSFADSLLADRGGVFGDGIPPDIMSIEATTPTMKLRVILRRIEFRQSDDDLRPTSYDAVILYSQTR